LILNKDWDLTSLFPVDTVNFVSASSKDMVWNTLLRILSNMAALSAQPTFAEVSSGTRSPCGGGASRTAAGGKPEQKRGLPAGDFDHFIFEDHEVQTLWDEIHCHCAARPNDPHRLIKGSAFNRGFGRTDQT